MVVADVARGDATDYSAFHIFDIEECNQVGEYKGKISPKDFGNILVGIAAEYNDALLVVECKHWLGYHRANYGKRI